ncbi:glucosamine-6-phosphate deaminase [Virgibacillus sp. JSM 102003]|uniref:glucosamine-6-phosphate deaminase n=1 Tax=Virgibacillus sp. JSM 102003 TaxID=1562108 RepID=UPI0035BEC27E
MKGMIHEGQEDQLKYSVYSDREAMGRAAFDIAAKQIKQLLEQKQEIRVIFAAAPSQNEFLYYLTKDNEIDWSRVVGFHMDEYIGLPSDSDERFKNYLQKNITSKVNMKDFHFIDGNANPESEIDRYKNLLNQSPIDIVCLGIGENGHIAFNDPPVADFQDPETIKVVELDQECRQQQVNDGCFPTFNDVPTHAFTLTIPALLSANSMICTVPGVSKKNAVYKVLNDKISTSCPATILRNHSNTHLLLDKEAYGGQ